MNILMSGLGGGGEDGAESAPGERLLSGLTPRGLGLAGLQGATSVLGAMSKMSAGRDKAQSIRASTLDDMLNMGQAEVAGQNAMAGLKQRLAASMGGYVAAAGAGNVDAGQGLVQDTNRAARTNEAGAEALTRGNIQLAQSRARMNMISKWMQADDAERAGSAGATGDLLSGGLSIAKLLL